MKVAVRIRLPELSCGVDNAEEDLPFLPRGARGPGSPKAANEIRLIEILLNISGGHSGISQSALRNGIKIPETSASEAPSHMKAAQRAHLLMLYLACVTPHS